MGAEATASPLRETMSGMDPRELYGLPLERFTETRNALVKRLRKEKRRDAAAEVSRLRKPTVAAWTVNQLVRTQPTELRALFEAGDRVQQVQADLLAGKANITALREAVEVERAAVDVLVDRARGFLDPDGHEPTGARREQIAETLHAGALDDRSRAQLREGCLERELRHVGLGGLVAPGRSAARTTTRPEQPRSGVASAGKPDRGAAAKERAKELGAARQAETQARRHMDRAARALEAAEQRRDRDAQSLREADAALADARRVAAEAARAHERARAGLRRLE